MARPRPDIVYVNQGNARVYQTVNAILKAGYTCRFLSGYYFRENGWPETILRRLPGHWANRILTEFKRRHLAKLPPEIVERSWMLEALLGFEVAFHWLFPNFGITRSRYIDLRAAIRVTMLRPRMVIVCDTHALYTLRAAKRIGAVAILDQVIGHVDAANKILGGEKKKRPEIGSPFNRNPDRIVRRCIKEVQEADYIFAPSDYVRDSLLPFGADPDRIFMLPYGVDLDMFAPAPQKAVSPFKVLFAGHIGLRKGVYYILEALRQAKLPGAQAVLLGNVDGDGAWLDEYQDYFVHIQHLPHQEIPKVFSEAHIYVYPSLHEGSTVSIYEAMASGLPVVTTPNAGSVVRDGIDGFVVPVQDVAAIRDRIERLYYDDDLRQEMGKNALLRAAEFSWDAYSKRLGEALDTVLKGRADA